MKTTKTQNIYTAKFSSNPTNEEKQIPFGTTNNVFFEQLNYVGNHGEFIVACACGVKTATLHIGCYCIIIPMKETIDQQTLPNEIHHKRFILNENNDVLVLNYHEDKHVVNCTYIIKQNGNELVFAKTFINPDLPPFYTVKYFFDFASKCANKTNGCNLRFVMRDNEVDMCLENESCGRRFVLPNVKVSTTIPQYPSLKQQDKHYFCLSLAESQQIHVRFATAKNGDDFVIIWGRLGDIAYNRDYDICIPNDLSAKNFFGILLKTANLMCSTKPANSANDSCGNFELYHKKDSVGMRVSYHDGLDFVFDLELEIEESDESSSDEESESDKRSSPSSVDDDCNPPILVSNVTKRELETHRTNAHHPSYHITSPFVRQSPFSSLPLNDIYISFDNLESLLNELFPQYNYKNKIHLATSPEAKTAFQQFAKINANYTMQTLFDIFKKDGANGFAFMSFSPMDTQKAKCIMGNIRIGLKKAIVKDVK